MGSWQRTAQGAVSVWPVLQTIDTEAQVFTGVCSQLLLIYFREDERLRITEERAQMKPKPSSVLNVISVEDISQFDKKNG